jgi:hypothetical protein
VGTINHPVGTDVVGISLKKNHITLILCANSHILLFVSILVSSSRCAEIFRHSSNSRLPRTVLKLIRCAWEITRLRGK